MAIIVLILFVNTSMPRVCKRRIWGGRTQGRERKNEPHEAGAPPTFRVLLRLCQSRLDPWVMREQQSDQVSVSSYKPTDSSCTERPGLFLL